MPFSGASSRSKWRFKYEMEQTSLLLWSLCSAESLSSMAGARSSLLADLESPMGLEMSAQLQSSMQVSNSFDT